jgi:NADH-quinone oxidoreductase subunit J
VTEVVFFVGAALAIATALGIILLQNPFYSVLALVANLIALALLFLLLGAEFVAFAQVVVYAGAVMVLYVFVTAYVGGSERPLVPPGGLLAMFAPLCAAALFAVITIAVGGSGLELLDSAGAETGPGFGGPGQIGALLLSKLLIPFELASYLLLVAAVGAIVLAQRRRPPAAPAGPAGPSAGEPRAPGSPGPDDEVGTLREQVS